jgi:hypothetical protein
LKEENMGGGGGGGGFSQSDAEQVQKAAEDRLKAIASQSTKVLFVCEAVDKKSLETLLAQSKVFSNNRFIVVDSSQANTIDAALVNATFLVAFTDQTKATPFIDSAIDKAIAKRISGVHAKAQANSVVPSKVSAYRWRSVTWKELEAIFTS